jgi:HlyD family secretion protein
MTLKNKRNWIIVGLAVVAIALFAAFGVNRQPQAQYFTAPVERGTIRAQVEATGTINALTSVQVGSQVSGTISALFVDFNSKVKKGQVIAQIDPAIFKGNLLQATADLENAKANLAAAKANLEKSKATAVQNRADFNRTEALFKEGVTSQQALDLARANADSADAQVNAAAAQVTQAAAQASQKQAAVAVAQTNMNYTTIRAPIDGTVVNRAVDVGQTVAASLQAPTLFQIAQDLTKMEVYAKTDESDVGRIRPGQQITFKVDAFPTETFRGVVKEVRMNPTTVQNVVTYDTIIDFSNPAGKLFPGMTAYVTIPVATAQDVLKIPNGALRFKPDFKPDEIKALYQKYNIDLGGGRKGGSKAGDPAAADSSQGASSSPDSANAGQQPGGGTEAAVMPHRGANGGASQADVAGAGNRNRGGAQAAGAGNGTGAATPREPRATYAVVWKLNTDKSLEPIKVKTGITDFTNTALLDGNVKEGDQLVTGSQVARSGGAPRLGGPGGGRPPGR